MDRYFQAFEHGTMPEDTCAPRIAALGEQTKALESRASELATLADSRTPVQRISEADLDALSANEHPRRAGRRRPHARQGHPPRTHRRNPHRRTRRDRTDLPCARGSTTVRFDGTNRSSIEPRSTGVAGLGRPRNWPLCGPAADLGGGLWPVGSGLAGQAGRRRLSSKCSPIETKPMRAKDIHAAVEALVGESVSWSSIKGALV